MFEDMPKESEEPYDIALRRIEEAAATGVIGLDLRELKLDTLPVEIAQLVSLISFGLSSNHLISLPAEIGQLAKLRYLHLASNMLEHLPAEIGQLIELTSLDLSSNKLTSLPPDIGKLANLTALDLSSNEFQSLPKEIGKLVRLETLTAYRLKYNGGLGHLPTEIGKLVNLRTLDLSSNGLKSLPMEIGKLVNLRNLDLSSNELKSLPVEIEKLVNLRNLDLSNNQFTLLPAQMEQLLNLTFLNLSGNEFEEIPFVVTKIYNLKHLVIRGADPEQDYAIGGKLVSIGKELACLTSLESLDLSGNKFNSFPLEILQFNNLTSLILSFAQITTLPKDIGALVNLTSLDLSNNKLTTLPAGIRNLENLRELKLNGNLLPIPPEILKKSEEPLAILDYYFSSLKKALNECKVLVVGQGSVGKTSLIRRLLENRYDPKENKTEGIDIRHFNFKANGTSYNINMWDFGGQEIMHATHQFFLTKRSLYILVLDSRITQEENRVEYWLKLIQSFGGDSPVLVVGNKTDQHPLDIDRTGLQKKYPNIVGIFETSAATGKGMDGLRIAIAEQIHNLPHVRDLLPESWFMVKKQLEELGRSKNFINHDEFLSLCTDNEVGEYSSQRTLIGFMHDLGVVLHFQDDPRLEALGILNPQWVTNGVYKILNAHALFQSRGVLKINMLNEILDLPDYPRDKRLFIVDMMKKFELCYDIETDKTFLVPDLLPKDEPFTGEWDSALAFQYHYTVLPSSVVTRFIVRMNEFIYKTVWRSGVVLKSGDNTALVKADMEDKKIYIWVSGAQNTRRDFLSAIRNQFDAIHKTITKLEVHEKVPVPEQVDVVVDFQHLLTLEQMGMNEYLPEGMKELVSVRQLLNGVAREEDRQRGGNVTNIYIDGDVKDSTLIAGDGNKATKK